MDGVGWRETSADLRQGSPDGYGGEYVKERPVALAAARRGSC